MDWINTAYIALISIFVSIVGTWATIKYRISSHETMLQNGDKKFKEIFDKISDDLVKKSDLIKTTVQVEKDINSTKDLLSNMCTEKHTSCNTHMAETLNIKTTTLFNSIEKLNNLVENKISESNKCMNDIKTQIVKLSSDFQNFKEITNEKLIARDNAINNVQNQLNSLSKQLNEVPSSIKESLVQAMSEVVNEIRLKDNK